MLSHQDIDGIRPGDVVKVGPAYRTVRLVSQKDGRPYWFVFAIRRCSWTHRPYTILSRHDLRQRATAVYRANKNVTATTLERRLQREIEDPKSDRHGCDCCDVRGVVD